MKTKIAKTLVAVTIFSTFVAPPWYLIRHMKIYPAGEIVRGESSGPFETYAECQADLENHANREGLECVQGEF